LELIADTKDTLPMGQGESVDVVRSIPLFLYFWTTAKGTSLNHSVLWNHDSLEGRAIKESLTSNMRNRFWYNDALERSAVSEGVYIYEVTCTDKAGNTSQKAVVSNIIYDAIPRSVNLSIQGSPFSPNNDNVKDNENDNDNVNENEINLPFSICNYIRIFILHFLFSSYISMR
jgi:hypothetical protein